jgi:hypothetical protein
VLWTIPPALPDPWRLIRLYDDGLGTMAFVLIAVSLACSILLLVMGNPERRKQASGKSAAVAPRGGDE